MNISRRTLLKATDAGAVALSLGHSRQVRAQDVDADDRVFICNEDSNTRTVIDPRTNTVASTINFTSSDEDPRPPFRFVTGGGRPPQPARIGQPPPPWW